MFCCEFVCHEAEGTNLCPFSFLPAASHSPRLALHSPEDMSHVWTHLMSIRSRLRKWFARSKRRSFTRPYVIIARSVVESTVEQGAAKLSESTTGIVTRDHLVIQIVSFAVFIGNNSIYGTLQKSLKQQCSRFNLARWLWLLWSAALTSHRYKSISQLLVRVSVEARRLRLKSARFTPSVTELPAMLSWASSQCWVEPAANVELSQQPMLS